MTPTLLQGDCLDVLQTLDECSVDSCVTDPPYGLGFMGKHWDRGVPDADVWREVYRVLKPGAHLLSFFGTRTYHRGAVAIEDAGFEIRDQIGWLYGSGFPKSLDVSKAIDKDAGYWRGRAGAVSSENGSMAGPNYERADKGDPITEAAKRWDGWGTALKPSHEPLVLARKPLEYTQEWATIARELTTIWSRLWLMLPASAAGESLPSNPRAFGVDPHASARWTADDASSTRGALSAGMDTSQFVSVLLSSLSTVWSWNVICAGVWKRGNTFTTEMGNATTTELRTLRCCLSEITPDIIIRAHKEGQWSNANASPAARYLSATVAMFGATLERSALAPAIESLLDDCLDVGARPLVSPIVVARKPLDGTVAANVLKWGTGGINVDGCRVGTSKDVPASPKRVAPSAHTVSMPGKGGTAGFNPNIGRFPANIIHDGSDEVLAEFAKYGESKSTARVGFPGGKTFGGSEMRAQTGTWFGDTGTAARFFYAAKSSKDDRNDGLWDYEHTDAADMVDREPDSAGMNSPRAGVTGDTPRRNHHPTVKPTSLMRYLVRLVTPKGGLVLDPFAGSGTTLIAAYREDCNAIGIELDPDYHKMASHRIDNATAQLRLDL